jgi:hypothetical protein
MIRRIAKGQSRAVTGTAETGFILLCAVRASLLLD